MAGDLRLRSQAAMSVATLQIELWSGEAEVLPPRVGWALAEVTR